MKTSLEWGEDYHRRVIKSWPGFVPYSILAEVIREARNEVLDEIIEALRHVDHLTPGFIEAMKEANHGA
jgi:hypothetical protein